MTLRLNSFPYFLYARFTMSFLALRMRPLGLVMLLLRKLTSFTLDPLTTCVLSLVGSYFGIFELTLLL